MRYPFVVIPLFLLSFVSAGQVIPEDDYSFRERMRSIVSDGNHQYDRSNRDGIKAAADSLEKALNSRRLSGLLNKADELEFTADLYKLRGDWHYENSNYDEDSYSIAEDYFLAALRIYLSRDDVIDLAAKPVIRRELAQLYYKEGLYDNAHYNICQAISAYDEAFLLQMFIKGDPLYYEWLDLRMQEAMCLARLGRADEAMAIADEVIGLFKKGSQDYYESIRKKAKIIMLSESVGKAKKALPLYKTYYEWRKKDAIAILKGMTPSERQDYWMRMRPFVTDCFMLEGEDPGFIFDVALFSKGLLLQMNAIDRNPDALKTLNLGWKDIQKSLPADGCAIEFIQYENGLGAVVVRKKGLPLWVPLMSPKEFISYEIDGIPNEKRIYTTDGSAKNAMYEDEGLKHKIWTDDLCASIGGCAKVYFSADGYIHQLAIEYMLPEQIADKKLYRLSSCRNLVVRRKLQPGAALIAGGITYLCDVDTSTGGNDALAYNYLASAGAYFKYLPGTRDESEWIYSYRKNPRDTLLKEDLASEHAIREMIGNYSILHLSTHGFFDAAEVSQGTDLKPCLADESLSQSSLALSGASKTLWSFSFDPRNQDGILSAAEIATLDMSKVDLAVLSACQTALGGVSADGVYGIQRGLKNAGAGAMVLSLWSVNDKATASFMSIFYMNLTQGMDIYEAFGSARKSLMEGEEVLPQTNKRQFNPRTGKVSYVSEAQVYDKPQFYDAFILIDAI